MGVQEANLERRKHLPWNNCISAHGLLLLAPLNFSTCSDEAGCYDRILNKVFLKAHLEKGISKTYFMYF